MVKEEVEQESGTEEVPTAQAGRRRKVTATPKDTSTAIGKTANAKTPLVPEPKAATTVFREKKIAALENGERANGMDGEGDDASLVPTTSTSRSAAAVGGKRARKAEVTNEGKERAVMKEEVDRLSCRKESFTSFLSVMKEEDDKEEDDKEEDDKEEEDKEEDNTRSTPAIKRQVLSLRMYICVRVCEKTCIPLFRF